MGELLKDLCTGPEWAEFSDAEVALTFVLVAMRRRPPSAPRPASQPARTSSLSHLDPTG